MLTTAVRVVGHDHITVVPFVQRNVMLNQILEARRHGIQVNRHPRGLGNAEAVCIKDTGRIVKQFPDHRRSAGTPNRHAHFLGGVGERTAYDREFNCVYRTGLRRIVFREVSHVWSSLLLAYRPLSTLTSSR